jgi:hypothetical protein
MWRSEIAAKFVGNSISDSAIAHRPWKLVESYRCFCFYTSWFLSLFDPEQL